jgi:HTH-type transcriptional regulator / antitoxin HipB
MSDTLTVSNLSQLVKTTRKRQSVRQQDLADLAGVSCRFLSDFENGKETVELGKVLAVLSTLGIDLTPECRDARGPSACARN